MTNRKPKPRTERTVWEVRSHFDVWGNAREGYEVNDSTVLHREYVIDCPIEVYNEGTDRAFESATPTDRQIREALDLRRFQLETSGDDLTIEVERKRDAYPCGSLHCTSHHSLSPIRPIEPSTTTIATDISGSEVRHV
jgi:hypothetical protein